MASSVHISLTVHDLDHAVDFYRRFFGEPAKLKPGYAKFVSRDPEIHLALGTGLAASVRGGALSHLGIRVGSSDEVHRWKEQLTSRGLAVEEVEPGECCYARQEKFWLTDPDGNRWEVYTVLEDVETTAPQAAAGCCAR